MASPYTYDQMRARQRALGPTGTSLPSDPTLAPVAADAAPDTVDDAVLNAPALEDSAAAPPAPAAPVAPARPQTTMDERRAKRAVVLHSLRNSPAGKAAFAKQLRSQYNLPATSKLTDDDVIQSAFDVQRGEEPDLTPHDFESDLHTAYGDKVDKHLLKQAHDDYPGITDENALVEKMYRTKVKNEELPPITYEDKAQIVARRYPKLHASAVDPDKGLQQMYKVEKAKGKDIGSYNDWLHSQMAPTWFERGAGAVGAIGQGLLKQVKDVGSLVRATGTQGGIVPGALAQDVVAAQAGDPAAAERLKSAARGAVTVGSFAAGAPVKAGIGALEGLAGATQTMRALTGALEGAAVGGAQQSGEAAVEGKPVGEVLQQGLQGAGVGIPLGAIAGAIHGHVEHMGELKNAAAEAARAEAYAKANTVDLPGKPPVVPVVPPPTDPLELAARHQREAGWEANISQFAKEHGMDREDVHALVDGNTPDLTNIAAAQMRHGVTIADINALKELQPEHLAEAPAVAPEAPAAPAAAPEAPAVRPTTPVERGLIQTPDTEKMSVALKRANAQQAERTALKRAQLSERLGAAEEAFKNAGGGLAGLRAKLSMMKGEIKRPEWNGVKDLFADVDRGRLHTAIAESNMLPGDKLTAHAGLERLLDRSSLGAPTASQLAVLRMAFGSEFSDAVMKDKTLADVIWNNTLKTLNTPRTIMSSMDLSAAMRQGYLMTSQPGYWRAWNTMMKAAGSEEFYKGAMQDIKDDGLYDIMRESGVKFQGPEFQAPSETFAGSWVDEAPGVKQSQQAYDAFINQTRRNVFRDVYTTAQDVQKAAIAAGEKVETDVTDPKFRQSLAHWVNTATGRGDLKFLGRDANILNAVLFSPRLAWSRVETFNPMYYAGLHPAIRRAALAANFKTVGATMVLLGTMAGSGLAKVSWDPRNSDFAKLRFGNTRIDMLGGHQQLVRMMAQITTGKSISSTTGREIDLNGSDEKNGFTRGSMNRADVLARFIEAKSAPLASLGLAILRGKDFLGRPISVENEVMTRLTPMPIQDISDALVDGGIPRGALVAPLALVGFGTQTYGPSLPASAGGSQKPDLGVAVSAQNWLWNKLNGNATDDSDLQHLDAKLANQWVADAAMAQMMAHHEATKQNGFFDQGFDQQASIRKFTARRMSKINKLYKDLAGANGEARRLSATQNVLQLRAAATGVDVDSLQNPEITEK